MIESASSAEVRCSISRYQNSPASSPSSANARCNGPGAPCPGTSSTNSASDCAASRPCSMPVRTLSTGQSAVAIELEHRPELAVEALQRGIGHLERGRPRPARRGFARPRGREARARWNPPWDEQRWAVSARRQCGTDLLQRRRILDRREIARIAPFGERLDRAPQQLARARLRQQRDEMHLRRAARSRRARGPPCPSLPCASSPRASGVATRLASLTTANATGTCPFTGSATPTTATSAMPAMRLHGLLDLARAEPMAGDVDHVVGAPEHEVVAVVVARRPVERRIQLPSRNRREIGAHEALVVAPHGGHAAGRQRRRDREHALLVRADVRRRSLRRTRRTS